MIMPNNQWEEEKDVNPLEDIKTALASIKKINT